MIWCSLFLHYTLCEHSLRFRGLIYAQTTKKLSGSASINRNFNNSRLLVCNFNEQSSHNHTETSKYLLCLDI